jgi:DNA-binding MarR family transcriptional regulator
MRGGAAEADPLDGIEVDVYTSIMNGTKPGAPQRGSDCACLSLRMASRAISQVYDEVLRPVGIKTTQFSLLSTIQKLGPVGFQRLAEKMVLDQTTLPRSLRLLEKEGYIRIEAGEDRRERLASVTTKGAAVVERALPYWRKAQDRLREKFPGDRLDKLMRELEQMRRAMAE